jgi:hypothetical protein
MNAFNGICLMNCALVSAASLVKWEPEAISEHRTVRTACGAFLAIGEPVQFDVRVLSGHVRLLEGVPRS